MKRIGQLKVMYKGMFIVMLLKSVSSAPVTSRTGRMKSKSFEGKPEGTRPIVNLGWARLSACRGGRSREVFYNKLYNRFVCFCAIHERENRFIIFREGATSVSVGFSRGSFILVELEFGDVGFCGGEKPENPEKKSSAQSDNQQ